VRAVYGVTRPIIRWVPVFFLVLKRPGPIGDSSPPYSTEVRLISGTIALRRTAVAQWLRCCATNRRWLVRSQLVSVDFSLTLNPSDRTMALGSTQSLTQMSTRSISWGQRRPVRKADTLPPSCAFVTKSGNLTSWNPLGLSRPVKGLLYLFTIALLLFAFVTCTVPWQIYFYTLIIKPTSCTNSSNLFLE